MLLKVRDFKNTVRYIRYIISYFDYCTYKQDKKNNVMYPMHYDSPVGLLINCKMRGLLVTMPEPLGKKSLENKYSL